MSADRPKSDEDLLRIVIDAISDPIVLKDANGKFLLGNKSVAELYNTTSKEMIGKDDGDFGVPKEMSDFFRANVLSIMEKGEQEIVFEDSKNTLTGEIHHFKSIKKPLKDKDGNNQILVVAQDITDLIKTQEKILKSEQRLENVLQATQEGIWDWYIPSGEVSHNLQWCVTLGYDEGELPETVDAFVNRIYPDDKEKVWEKLTAHLNGECEYYYSEHRMIRKNGDIFWVRDKGQIVEIDDDGVAIRMMGSFSDITHRKAIEEKLELAANVFMHATEGILITDANEVIIDVNNSFTRISGYSREEVLGKTPRILHSNLQSREYYEIMWDTLIKEGYWHGEIWNKRKNGSEFAEMQTISSVCDANGNVQQYVAFISDITDIKENERYLKHIAYHDILTTLPNRVLLADRLNTGIIRSFRNQLPLAVIYLDLDGFKEINDFYGHQTGDDLLIVLAKRMKESLRESDTLARIGGDEFVAVLFDLISTSVCFPMLERLLEAASKPVELDNATLHVTASIGVTFYPQHENVDADQLLRQADQAMYQAKLSGKNRYHIFDIKHDNDLRGKHATIERIRSAISDNEFVLYYQPKVNMRTGQLKGSEALIRWLHPEKGLIPPLDFLPFVENHPLSIEIGEWVIRTALAQLQSWNMQGLETTVSINIGAYQLLSTNFTIRLRNILDEFHHVNPSQLEIEILETSTLENLNQAVSVIQKCNNMGIRFALDDFGTGYSSLTYLKQLPVKVLKIDQTFVRGMLEDPDDLAILEGILGMGSAFRKEIIAEGVETVEHGEMLLLLGCELAQGYGIARPMPASEIMLWQKQWKPNDKWLQTVPISHHDFPLLFANIGHRAWINALEAYVMGQSPSYPELNYSECHFGKWLISEGESRYHSYYKFDDISQEHSKIHQLANEVIAFYHSEQIEQMHIKLDELRISRDSLLDMLYDLQHVTTQK